MSENIDNEKIKLGDTEISLADLAGFDMSGVIAKKFENVPEGHFAFEILSDPMPDLAIRAGKGAAIIPCKVTNITALKNPAEVKDPTALIGKVHYETALVNNQESLEYLMATFEALGATKGPLRSMLHSLAGITFTAGIKHRTDKNDSDKVYAGLVRIDNVKRPTASGLAVALGKVG